MLMTDQMHKYALGTISPFVQTPNLDRLASEGTIFTNAYSNNPVCTPFRGILFSGCYSKDNHVQENRDFISGNELCLADEMHLLGYDTSFVGKLHLGETGNQPVPEKFRAGHRHFLGYQCYNEFQNDVCFYDEEEKEYRYEGHRTDITATLGMERMRELAKTGKPFLHTIFFQAPHYPEQPSPYYEKIYDDIEIPLPECYNEIEPFTPTCSPRNVRPIENCPNYQKYGGDIQKYLKLYYAMVSQIDANVGRILDELERLGIAKDTAVIFSSDHGDMQGSHGMKNKCLPYERSCGIPLIIKVPGIKQQPIVDIPVSAVDFYPTCLDIVGGKSRKDLPGASLLPLISSKETKHPDVFAENHNNEHDWYMLRDKQFKLVVNASSLEIYELFDMENDSIESRNLAFMPEYETTCEELLHKLKEILQTS